MTPIRYQDIMLAHLWKRPDNGVYYAVWQPPDGHLRRKTLKTTDERHAKARLNSVNRDLVSGKIKPIAPRITSRLADFTLKFLEHVEAEVSKDELRSSTYTLFKVALDKAEDAWGRDKNLLRLKKEDIEFYRDHISRGLKKVTVNKNIRHLKAALKKGQEWGVVNRDLTFPRQWKTNETIRYFSRDELQKLMAAITDQDFRDVCLLSAYSGMRSGEIIRLTARDIDNPTGFIRITPEQKSRQEDRIPINDKMRAILDCHRQDIGHLFRWRRVDHISATFRSYAIKAGFSDHRFHDLRHTFGAHLVMAGVDIRTVQLLMRHRSIESTLVYTRLFPSALVAPSNVLNYGIMR